ncbi:hypothetical protein [Streptomyces sp. NRRL S-87]|uniref:hypothetical protein n=1 Tax=Streptomyces sp. NRRL S-87 TaxID=1463920 RepID=UPI00068BF313|nr:hypothetical protein [Streptomyces sp. NRRL S-87]
MNRLLARGSALAAAVLAISGITALSPASGAETCTTTSNAKPILLPGIRPDTVVSIPVCLETLSGGKGRGKILFHWKLINDGQSDVTSKRFSSFQGITRLASREPGGEDTGVKSPMCGFTDVLNSNAPEDPRLPIGCQSPWAVLDPGKQWSGDATAVYDIVGDGLGPITWQLAGSPSASR